MKSKEMLKNIFSGRSICIMVLGIILPFIFNSIVPKIIRIIAGLWLVGIILLVVFLELKTKKQVLKELKEIFSDLEFNTAMRYLRYWTSFNISISEECPNYIKKEVIAYFKGLGWICETHSKSRNCML